VGDEDSDQRPEETPRQFRRRLKARYEAAATEEEPPRILPVLRQAEARLRGAGE
jgi:hypothetical protein